MVNRINNTTIATLMRCQIPMQAPEEVREAAPEQRTQQQYETNRGGGADDPLSNPDQAAAAAHDTRAQQPRQPIVKDKMPGRNDPCPCGSGKKFKNCHGKGLV